jgi:anti-sigma regulatory factor (Ser/Thr protein kinase)
VNEHSWPLAHDIRAPARARRILRDTLTGYGIAATTVDEIALLASELVTNAVVHGREPHELRCRVGDVEIEVAVTDRSNRHPVVAYPSPSDAHGRGLSLVDRLASDWGVSPEPAGGKAVWFLLPH